MINYLIILHSSCFSSFCILQWKLKTDVPWSWMVLNALFNKTIVWIKLHMFEGHPPRHHTGTASTHTASSLLFFTLKILIFLFFFGDLFFVLQLKVLILKILQLQIPFLHFPLQLLQLLFTSFSTPNVSFTFSNSWTPLVFWLLH